MFSLPSIEIEILQVEYKSQFANLGHSEKSFILLLRLKKGPTQQAKNPANKAEAIYPE